MEKLSKYEKLTILILSILIFLGGIIFLFTKIKPQDEIEVVKDITDESKVITEAEEIFIHITGAVAKPGVYKTKQNTRLIDIVLQAQPLPYADINQLNLASVVSDGQKIIVPEKNISSQNLPSHSAAQSSLVNINTASESELVNLPGIGPATAKKIINHRQERGNFKSIDDIKNVPGIGNKKFEQFKNLITAH